MCLIGFHWGYLFEHFVDIPISITDTFWTNPQYRVQVIDPDEDDDDNTGTLIVGLLQKERRKKQKEGLDMLTIGYSVYQVY